MTCEWHSKIDPYVDAALPEADLAQMEAHVRVCPSCAAEALSRSQMKRVVRAAAGNAFTPRPEFRLKIEQAIGARQKPKRRWFQLPQLALATAAFAVIVLCLGLWWYRAPQTDAIAEVADLHVSALASANPVDVISTDRHTVKPWFEGKLPFTFNVPELQNSRFRLIGGKVTYLEQNPGAQLLFGVRKHQISVFIFQDRDGLARLGSNPSEKRKLEFTIETWAEGGLRYFVISDASPDDVHALSELLQAAARS
jgi:anti-sigma factor RsiW